MNLAIHAPRYEHTQRGPLSFLLICIALAFTTSAILVPVAAVSIAHGGVAALVLVLAFCFRGLTLRDEGEELAIRYGPLPVFRKKIRYADISAVKGGKTAFIDGLGIHWVPFRGWTYNLWGRDCAVLTVKGKTVRIGTDDADELVAHIKERLGTATTQGPTNST